MIIEKTKSVAVSLLRFIKLLPKKEMVLYIISFLGSSLINLSSYFLRRKWYFISFLRFFIRVKAL